MKNLGPILGIVLAGCFIVVMGLLATNTQTNRVERIVNKLATESTKIAEESYFEGQKDAIEGDVEALRRLIPEVEATNIIVAAATSQFDDFNKKLEAGQKIVINDKGVL